MLWSALTGLMEVNFQTQFEQAPPPTSFPGFSPTRPYGARERERERETLVGSGHVVTDQN